MKFMKITTGEKYEYEISPETVCELIIGWLKERRLEMPHPEDRADTSLTMSGDLITLTIERTLPKGKRHATALKAMPPRPIREEPEMPKLDLSKMSVNELLNMAVEMEEEQSKVPLPQNLPLRRYRKTTTKSKTSRAINFVMSSKQPVSVSEVTEHLGLDATDPKTCHRVGVILHAATRAGRLQRKTVKSKAYTSGKKAFFTA